jgi:hypothetical protein
MCTKYYIGKQEFVAKTKANYCYTKANIRRLYMYYNYFTLYCKYLYAVIMTFHFAFVD